MLFVPRIARGATHCDPGALSPAGTARGRAVPRALPLLDRIRPAPDEPGTGWSALPDHLLESVLCLLKLDDRVRCSAVCSAWAACARRRHGPWTVIRVGDIHHLKRDRFLDSHLLALCDRAGAHLAVLDVSSGLLRHHAAWTADGVMQALERALARRAPLAVLNVARAAVGDAGAALAAEAARRGTLTTLSLRSTGLGSAGLEALCVALRDGGGGALRTLDVGWNKLRSAGAAQLGEALSENRTLTALHLPGNELGDGAAAGLARALGAERTALALLDLECNGIGAAGAAALALATRGNATLTALNLRDNCVGPSGAESLAAAIAEGRLRAPPLPLRSLDLVGNGVGGVGAMALTEAARGGSCGALLSGGLQLGSVLARGGGGLGSGQTPLMACLQQELGAGSQLPSGYVHWPRQIMAARPAAAADAAEAAARSRGGVFL